MLSKTADELQAVADEFWAKNLRLGFAWELGEALKNRRIYEIYKLSLDPEIFDTNGGSSLNYFLNTVEEELNIGQDEAACLYQMLYAELTSPEQKAADEQRWNAMINEMAAKKLSGE